MSQSRTETLILVLMTIVLLLMVAIGGLFFRMTQLQQGFDFPVLGWEDDVAGAYLVPGTPFFYVIDGTGMVVNGGFAGSLEQLEALVGAGER